MASPDLLGASSGASFGAALGIILGLPSGGVTGLAFLMSLLTVLAAWLVSRASKGSRVMTLVLSGMMVSSLFTAGTSYLKLVADPEDQLQEITYWLMGSLSGADWGDLRTAILPAAIGITILLLLRWRAGGADAGGRGSRSPRGQAGTGAGGGGAGRDPFDSGGHRLLRDHRLGGASSSPTWPAG